jgi:hypothetical protein
MGGVKFKIFYGLKNKNLRIRAISHHTERFHEAAPFGRVKSGFLEVEAFLCALSMILGYAHGSAVGLFLEPVGDETYRRIGLFSGDWGWPASEHGLPEGARKLRLFIV